MLNNNLIDLNGLIIIYAVFLRTTFVKLSYFCVVKYFYLSNQVSIFALFKFLILSLKLNL